MKKRIGRVLLTATGVLNLLPGAAVLAPEMAGRTYGVDITAPDWEALIRHRALLLALVGGLAVAAVFRPALRPVAITANTISMGSFAVIAVGTPALNAELTRIACADIGGSLLLLSSALLLREPRPAEVDAATGISR